MEGISYQVYNFFGVVFPLAVVAIICLYATLGVALHLLCCDESMSYTFSTISIKLHGFWLQLQETSKKEVCNEELVAIKGKTRVLQERSPFQSNNQESRLENILTKIETMDEDFKIIDADAKWTVRKEIHASRFQDQSMQLVTLLNNEIPVISEERVNGDSRKADNLLKKMENMVDKMNKSKDKLKKLSDDKHTRFDRLFVSYPLIGFFCAVLDATLMFFSNAILTQSTGSCDVRMDCFAVSSNSNDAISILNYGNCSDYLMNSNYTVRCYTLSFNYAVALGKASSALSFLGF